MKVLIITHSGDNDCIDRVTEAVEGQGASVVRLDTDRFPTEIRLSASDGPDGDGWRLDDGERSVELADVDSVWYRRIRIGAGIPEDMEEQRRKAAVEESRRSLLGALATVRGFVMDPLPRIRHAEHKSLQLRLARELGLETPRTLTTNDPAAARAFFDACGGHMITKMLASFAIHEDGMEKVVFTNEVSPDDLEHLDGLRLCPMTFQESVPKRCELRATVVGERVFTASIDSQSRERARGDWRREGVAMIEEWERYDLPPGVEERLLRLTDRLGLNYGAIDLIVTPDDRHVFLEINPAGEFYWLEKAPGLPISGAIADVLLDRAPRRQAPLLAAD